MTSTLAPSVRRAAVTDVPLSVADHERLVADPASGAVVTFTGVVRDHDHGRAVSAIEYVGHPIAAELLAAIAVDVVARTGVRGIAITHRVGPLAVGDLAMVASIGAVHRGEAFGAIALLVDQVKARLPIWKRQVFADGTEEWVACP